VIPQHPALELGTATDVGGSEPVGSTFEVRRREGEDEVGLVDLLERPSRPVPPSVVIPLVQMDVDAGLGAQERAEPPDQVLVLGRVVRVGGEDPGRVLAVLQAHACFSFVRRSDGRVLDTRRPVYVRFR
jgi:hypothetical protein